ncbi:hypothetical protein Fmac_017015 [Flemingia macrophylla]|uniref:Bidirectional sugar transporter SWEET n=1 Tax=Flemingia macrophylla TaxID=520843 RepID=A0ABD1M0W9_9FABA
MVISHHTLACTFGMLGNVISLLVFLAPMPTFCRIYMNKSTESFQSLPYLVALFSSMLWLYHALLKKNALLLVTINSFGCVVETIYIVFYITYATRDARSITIKLYIFRNEHRLLCFDLLSDTLYYAWYPSCPSPRMDLCFHFSQCLCSTTKHCGMYQQLLISCIALPNVLGFVLGLLQMMLYIIYRKGNKKGNTKEKSPVEPLKNIVVTGEVFPVEEDKQAEKSQEDKTSQDCVV